MFHEFGKPVYVVLHDPRRHPHHGRVASQVVWWNDETVLFAKLKDKLHAGSATIEVSYRLESRIPT